MILDDRLTADGQRGKEAAGATMARMEEDLAGGREREERREAKIAELENQVALPLSRDSPPATFQTETK